MIRRIKRFFRHYIKLFRRKIRHMIFRFLVAVHEGEIRFSFFYTVCFLCAAFLCLGFTFGASPEKEAPAANFALGSELTQALRHSDSRNTEAAVDVTLFLLPDTENEAALSSFYDSRLYGFYLTGKELTYLPELYASLSDSFVYGTPYIGGLSFSYNPKRFIYNRATDISLYTKEGTVNQLSKDTLYYVVGTESVFSMFHYLSERTFHLLSIQPKDAQGSPVSDYSGRLLLGAGGSLTVADIYNRYPVQDRAVSATPQATDIMRCNSLNTSLLFTQLNPAGYFLIGCILLFTVLAAIVRPHLRRIIIWFRLFMFHRRKRAKFSLRTRIYSARIAKRHVA